MQSCKQGLGILQKTRTLFLCFQLSVCWAIVVLIVQNCAPVVKAGRQSQACNFYFHPSSSIVNIFLLLLIKLAADGLTTIT